MEAEPESRSIARHLVNLFFGVALPLGCLIYDPIVFRGFLGGGGILGNYLIVGYLATGIGFLSIGSWTFLRVCPAFHSGTLLGAGVFAACLGIALFPISVLCLLILIGVFGFTPFITAWIFFREARVAARSVPRTPMTIASCAVGVLLSCGLPWAAQIGLDREIDRAMKEAVIRDSALKSTVARLRPLAAILPDSQFDRFVWRRANESDPAKKEALANAYWEITGHRIETRLSVLD